MAVYNFIDVSSWQGKIDWAKVKKAGIVGAIIRYADGNTIDSRFDENMKNAKAAGLHVGCYIFSRATTSAEAEKEATRLYNAAKGYSPDMPLYIDLEVAANKKYADIVAAAYLNKMKALGGYGGVYANLNWWNNYLTKTAKNYTASPFWIAQYYSQMQYKPASYMGMWQYSSSGKVNGISGRVDMDKCYVDYWNKIPKPEPKPEPDPPAPTKTIDELAEEVLEGKWGSGDDRKKRLEAAGYDYYAVQKRVNELLEVGMKVLDACAVQADWMKNYKYEWESNPTVEKSKKKGTCVTYVSCVCQRIGYLKSGTALWCDGKGYGDGHIKNASNKMQVIYMGNKTIAACKSSFRPGDVVCLDDNKSGETGCGGHFFVMTGSWTKDGEPYIWDNQSANRRKQGKEGKHSYSKTRKVLAIIRMKPETVPEKQPYSGTYPTLAIKKSNEEVIFDTIKWAKWIAGNNDFHYGYTNKKAEADAHHNGCYFCRTQKLKKNMLMPEHTYCCNPFIGAAWAHGGCVPAAMKLCQKCNSWDFHKGKGYDKSSLFNNLGHPAKSSLKAGDILCKDTHVVMYIGDNKIIEAAHGDDNVKYSTKWNDSIHIRSLTDGLYKNFPRVHRFNSKVDTSAPIYHGEISERVKNLQLYLTWYGLELTADGIFGDATFDAVKTFQKDQELTVDGIVGSATIAKMKEVKK